MALCPSPVEAGIVGGVVETVDCHIRILVHDTYRELVGPGTWFATAFTGLLTIYIALVGYQLLLGRGGLRVTQLPYAAIKIGVVLAFLTSWAAYQTLVFNLLFDGPGEILRVMMGSLEAQNAGFSGDVLGGVEATFKSLSESASAYGGMASPSANLLQGGPMLGSGLLWLSGVALLLATLGLLIASKIVLAFLLALGPLFIGMLLFDATRGLFEGWLRTTVSFALVPLAVTVFGAVMLLVLDPYVGLVTGNAARRLFDMGPVITIALIVGVFIIVMLFGIGAVAGIARGLGRSRGDATPPLRRLPPPDLPAGQAPGERAEQLAARIAMIDRATSVYREAQSGMPASRRVGDMTDAVASGPVPSGARLGQAYSRSPQTTSAQPATRRGDA